MQAPTDTLVAAKMPDKVACSSSTSGCMQRELDTHRCTKTNFMSTAWHGIQQMRAHSPPLAASCALAACAFSRSFWRSRSCCFSLSLSPSMPLSLGLMWLTAASGSCPSTASSCSSSSAYISSGFCTAGHRHRRAHAVSRQTDCVLAAL